MKRIIITLLALVTLGGVASADRGRPPTVRDHRSGGVVVQPAPGYQRRYQWHQQPRYNQNYRYQRPGYRYYSRPSYYTRGYGYYAPRPIYVRRPYIQYRYFNYYQRPSLIVERYPSIAGYIWVAGQWSWDGYEWIWQPGHYEPDPSYTGVYSNQLPSYDGTYYYDNGY